MFKKAVFFVFSVSVLTFHCSILEPSKLLVKNDSNYNVVVNVKNSDKKDVHIDKKKGNMFFVNPGEIELTIEIDEFKYEKKYNLSIGYLENKEFIFNVKL